jgi:hypothetical protein
MIRGWMRERGVADWPRPMRVLASVLPALAALATAPAQSLAWNVPPRGALVYARTTARMQVLPPFHRGQCTWVAPSAEDGSRPWRWFACRKDKAPEGWEQPRFDDGTWDEGPGEFGNDARHPHQRTQWSSDTLLLRARIDVGPKKPKALLLRLHHDDGVRVFCNGALLLDDRGVGRDRQHVLVGDRIAAVQAGENAFAVQCDNTGGAQYLDVAIGVIASMPAGVRAPEALPTALGDQQARSQRARSGLLPAFRPPALVLQGELDALQQRPVPPPGDLRELAFWVACDLQRTTAGPYAQDVPRLYRLGDLQLRGKVSAVDGTGWQELDVAVKSLADPLPRGDSKRSLDMHVRPYVLYGLDARLNVRRRIETDGSRARLAECRCTLEGRLLAGKDWKDHVADLQQDETCRFERAVENQDAAFRRDVAAAIDDGTKFLAGKLRERTTSPSLKARDESARSYPSGRLALALLAMIKGGVPRDDPGLLAALDDLRGRTLVDTYSLGNALMALEAFHAPAYDRAEIEGALPDASQRRTVPERDRALLQRWTDQVLENVDTRVDPDLLLRFSYVREARFDQSVNQYGLLGLWSAHLCGISVPAARWEAAIDHWLTTQCAEGQALVLDLTTGDRVEQRRGPALSPVRPAGWTYEEPKNLGEDVPAFGSMTCAGITGLAICQAALRELGTKRQRLQDDADDSRRAAFAWLAQHLTVRCNPGWIERQQRWLFYYLYSLERAARLSGVALIQGRDWYFEGSMLLTQTQQPDGSWPGELHPDEEIERAAMAVLFLKRGTAPVLTGR